LLDRPITPEHKAFIQQWKEAYLHHCSKSDQVIVQFLLLNERESKEREFIIGLEENVINEFCKEVLEYNERSVKFMLAEDQVMAAAIQQQEETFCVYVMQDLVMSLINLTIYH